MKKRESLNLPPGTKIPKHIAIIPDGNRRWAREHSLPTIEGHKKGFNVLLNLFRKARSWGVHTLTLWFFSTENWKRSPQEASYLMKTAEDWLKKHLPEAQKEKVRVIHLGRKDRIPKSLAQALTEVEKKTRKNKKHVLNIALDYGGRDEILRAITRMSNLKCKMLDLTEDKFAKFLDTSNQPYPYPDLLIRPSGEMRTSGLLPWQTTYTEFYFLTKYLPDMTLQDLKEAILEYSRRERRLGGESKR